MMAWPHLVCSQVPPTNPGVANLFIFKLTRGCTSSKGGFYSGFFCQDASVSEHDWEIECISLILANGYNITKSETFKGDWIFSVLTVQFYWNRTFGGKQVKSLLRVLVNLRRFWARCQTFVCTDSPVLPVHRHGFSLWTPCLSPLVAVTTGSCLRGWASGSRGAVGGGGHALAPETAAPLQKHKFIINKPQRAALRLFSTDPTHLRRILHTWNGSHLSGSSLTGWAGRTL